MRTESTRKANSTIEKRLIDEFKYSEDQISQLKKIRHLLNVISERDF